MLPSPKVVFSAGIITHYHHAARALSQAGMLKKYFYGAAPAGGLDWLVSHFPSSWRRKFDGRSLPDIPRDQFVSLLWPEVFYQALLFLPWVSRSRASSFFARFFDWEVARQLPHCDIYHYTNMSALYSAQKARKQGSTLICDVRTIFPVKARELIEKEHVSLGLPISRSDLLFEKKRIQQLELADYIIVPSEYAAQTFRDAGLNSDRIFTLPYGANVSQVENDKTSSISVNEEFNILFVGQISAGKGVHHLVDAFHHFKASNARLTLVGGIDPLLAPLVEIWKARDPRIHLVGFVPHLDLKNYFHSASVFVLPSVSEGFGLVVYEAMGAGLPVVVTSNCGAVVEDGEQGFVVPAGESAALLEKITWLYNHPKDARLMGENATNAIKRFSWERYGEQLIQIYKKILGSS